MGVTSSKPYIIDEFDSDDDDVDYESAQEYTSDCIVFSQPEPVTTGTESSDRSGSNIEAGDNGLTGEQILQQNRQLLFSNDSPSSLKGLGELLKLIESHDFDEAQRVAYQLKKNHMNTVSVPQSVKSENSSAFTSTWPSKTQEEITEKLSSFYNDQSGAAGDLSDDQRKEFALLDEELIQFEANEEKLSLETPATHSGIPRLIAGSHRLGRSAGYGSEVGVRPAPERRRSRSPSPHGNRPSGIPRYSWAHVAPISPSIPNGESASEKQMAAACNSSNTLESLPEFTDRRQTPSYKINSLNEAKSFSSESQENQDQGPCEARNSTPQWNVSDYTCRVKTIKKHSCLPSLWVNIPQRTMKSPQQNGYHIEGCASAMTSEVSTGEKAVCKSSGESVGPSEKKVLDLKRWSCISRPQYKTSCGISAVVSCWNYLFSTMGHGRLPPITQETAMKLLGFTSPFENINFGPHTGNQKILRWFRQLNVHFNVNGQCSIVYKPSGKNQTTNITEEMALHSLKKGLKSHNTAYIYHCHNHYFCPIGYEDSSQFCADAYKSDIGEGVDTWLIFGDTSRKHSPLYCQSWEKICLDLNCKSPCYFNIRKSWKGVLHRKSTTNVGENLHCIMTFQKASDHPSPSPSSISASSNLSKTNSPRLTFPPKGSSVSPTRQSSGLKSVDTLRPELGPNFPADLEEAEVGYENLESDSSDDELQEISNKKVILQSDKSKDEVIKISNEINLQSEKSTDEVRKISNEVNWQSEKSKDEVNENSSLVQVEGKDDVEGIFSSGNVESVEDKGDKDELFSPEKAELVEGELNKNELISLEIVESVQGEDVVEGSISSEDELIEYKNGKEEPIGLENVELVEGENDVEMSIGSGKVGSVEVRDDKEELFSSENVELVEGEDDVEGKVSSGNGESIQDDYSVEEIISSENVDSVTGEDDEKELICSGIVESIKGEDDVEESISSMNVELAVDENFKEEGNSSENIESVNDEDDKEEFFSSEKVDSFEGEDDKENIDSYGNVESNLSEDDEDKMSITESVDSLESEKSALESDNTKTKNVDTDKTD